MCVCVLPPPCLKRSLLLWDVFVLCEASQLNGLWPGEVSSVDLGVTWRQWWPSFYRKNKNRDPQACGLCRGRGLNMVGHFREEGKELVLHQRICFRSAAHGWKSQIPATVFSVNWRVRPLVHFHARRNDFTPPYCLQTAFPLSLSSTIITLINIWICPKLLVHLF